MQGVWGAARHPSGGCGGQRPPASRQQWFDSGAAPALEKVIEGRDPDATTLNRPNRRLQPIRAGACGGFQHVLIEYARNELGLIDADHAESNPETSLPLMVALECALVEATGTIVLQLGSRVATLYNQSGVVEAYHCRFGLNRHYEALLADTDLRVSGRDSGGEVRIIELESHPFYVATLFQPERSAFKGHAHPLITAYVGAALAWRAGTLESAGAAVWNAG